MNTNDAKEYLSKRQIPKLFESMLTGLMFHRPEDPLHFLETCLQKTREVGGVESVAWDTFITPDRRPLPPINTTQSKKAAGKLEGASGPGPGPYRRYERLPPIQAQFSIESDSDMTESSGLIQEYDVFDPNMSRPHIIFVIGGPGSGKGTQTLKMAAHYAFECVSVGEILRNQLLHHATTDRKWELIAQIIANGELAPQETTIEELKHQFMKKQDAKGFIVDGFPREIAQAFTFEEQIGSPDLVILLACSNQQLRQRLEKRAAQQGRPDDNTHAIEKRLETFKHNITLIAKYYQERGLIVRIDADRGEDDIFTDISAVVQERLFPNDKNTVGAEQASVGASASEHSVGAAASEHSVGASASEHSVGASASEHSVGAAASEHSVGASASEHSVGASASEHSVGASASEHSVGAAASEHSVGASASEHSVGAAASEHSVGAAASEHPLPLTS